MIPLMNLTPERSRSSRADILQFNVFKVVRPIENSVTRRLFISASTQAEVQHWNARGSQASWAGRTGRDRAGIRDCVLATCPKFVRRISIRSAIDPFCPTKAMLPNVPSILKGSSVARPGVASEPRTSSRRMMTVR